MFEVVIIEDEDLIRKGLIYTFDWLNYDCVIVGEASNGKEGLNLINRTKPDIVITDIKMPIMDGLEMIESFEKRNFETIIITSYAEFDYAKKAIRCEVSDFILKPIDHDELARILNKIKIKIKKKNMCEKLNDKVKTFTDIILLDVEFYFNDSSYESWLIPKVLDFIENNYFRKINIDCIADKLEVSSTYLSKKFKEETKNTFNDFLNKYRIQKALEYMYEDNMRIYEIAELVGYSEYKYFSRVFKKYMEYSPSEFIKMKLFIKHNKICENLEDSKK